MIQKSISSAQFKKFVYTPAGYNDATLAVGASRAGGIGILNAELGTDHGAILGQLDFLSRKAAGEYGLKLDTSEDKLLAAALEYAGKGLRWLILDGDVISSCRQRIAEFRQTGVSVLAEVRTGHWPESPLDDLIDGLVLKGNEAGGFVGESSSFILLQKWRGETGLPIYVRGGITPNVAAACCALGVAGGVLDSQVLLFDESPLAGLLMPFLKNLSGNETAAVGDAEKGDFFRLLLRPGFRSAQKFSADGEGLGIPDLRRMVQDRVNWNEPAAGVLPIGQDVCFAESWQKKYGRMAALFQAIDAAIEISLEAVADRPLYENSPLAQSLGAALPIVQGPMARVSDNIEFAYAVSTGGALPTIALSLVSGRELNQLLDDTCKRLGDNPWGVGMIGFAPEALLDEQFAAVKKYKPRFAVVAGGRPDQASKLEERGIAVFLHVPSVNLIPLFLQEGARRFIFEGRECGGHIGPLSSFVLWSAMVDQLLSEVEGNNYRPEEIQILFAGGIHDAFSSALVQVLAAPITAKGVKTGILMGSGYIFTREIVESGALSPTFQKKAIDCAHTVCLTAGPGHASRCAYTPFARIFYEKCRQLREKHLSVAECREMLEKLQMGRLQLATKGCAAINESGELQEYDEEHQQREGMYMLGQLATLRGEVTDIPTLHAEVTADAHKLIRDRLGALKHSRKVRKRTPNITGGTPVDVAIVGMAGLFPKADTIEAYWENILSQVEAITEIPPERWDWRLYYDENRQARDKVYSKWGGFIQDLVFDPTRYGIPPKSIESVDPMQLMALEVARRTLIDAGYEHRPYDREHTSVIIGASGGVGDVGMQYGVRTELPRFQGNLPDKVAGRLPQWTEDTFAGILPNVTAGRIANRFNLGGVNFTTDAACASSLAAIYQGVSELTAGRSGFVLAGGIDSSQGPFGYMCFSKTQALSPRGRCRTFDNSADGIVISEGIAMIAMKRLKDAIRDGDRIYAVIKGVGGSSDGRSKGLTAPAPAGQLAAMRRAYDQAGFGPDTVGLFEAHGTGTIVGDTAELESTTRLLSKTGCKPRRAAVGSVKTLIGHTKATAGVAGVIKVALALHHRVIPPHFPVDDPNAVLMQEDCPLYLPDEALPWLTEKDRPCRGASSAFGFGGTNFHVVMEEYTGEYRPWMHSAVTKRWPSELLLWSATDGEDLVEKLTDIENLLEKTGDIELRHLAFNLARKWRAAGETAAIVASDAGDLRRKIGLMLRKLKGETTVLPPGVVHGSHAGPRGKVAVLFPGQGSQYINMFRELAVHFPVLGQTLSEADKLLSLSFEKRFGADSQLSRFIFPRGAYGEQAKSDAAKALTRTDVAQPALGAVCAGVWKLMRTLGLEPDMLGGHSYGEFAALFAGGHIDFPALMSLSEARGRFIVDAAAEADSELGTMAAVQASREEVEKVISDIDDVIVANHNAPLQIVISGSAAGVRAASERFSAAGIKAQEIPVAAAFHSRFVEPAKTALAELIDRTEWSSNGGAIPVYSNTTGGKHDGNGQQIKKMMADHLVKPVEFLTQIEAMYRDGARVFLELGPKTVLTGLTGRILGQERPHQAVALDGAGGGITAMLNALAQLLCAGVELKVSSLFEGRDCLHVDPADLSRMQGREQVPKHAWILNGSGARRVGREPGRPIEGIQSDASGSHTAGAQQNKEKKLPVSQKRTNVPAPLIQVQQPKKELHMSVQSRSINSRDSEIMSEYFATMRMFLETQERVMATFAGGGAADRRPGSWQQRPIPPQQMLQPTRRPMLPDLQAAPPAGAFVAQPAGREDKPAASVQETAVMEPPQPAKSTENVQSVEAGNDFDEKKLTELLLSIVEDKTGYPRDMVGLDQQLESDLGIDSIKRVEIVGALLNALPQIFRKSLDGDQKKLNTQPTLKGMVSLLAGLNVRGENALPFSQTGVGSAAGAPDHSLRYVITPKQEPIDRLAVKRLEKGLFIVTQDQLGVACALAESLRGRGCTVQIAEREVLQDETALDRWTESLETDNKTIAGVVHLAQLGSGWHPEDAALDCWQRQLQINEKSLFIILHHLSGRIGENAHILSASGLGGLFNRGREKAPGLSIQGGAVGLLKSLYQERKGLRVKAVDIDPAREAGSIAEDLLNELELAGGRQEVGYPNGVRTIFQTISEPISIREDHPETLRDLVVLATGGSRGVTAEVLRDLALPGNTLLLTGRSPLPGPEPEELQPLKTFPELRQHFISEVRGGHLQMTPAEIRRRVQSVLSAREMRLNMEDFRRRGAQVVYFPVDVTDHDAMKTLITGIYDDYGRIDGVLHAAGVIEDKLLADKNSDSWARVVETKVMGLLLLQKYLRPESLKFLTVFSSVAGRYGNSGQSDYATANELMNRLCCQLSSLWDRRVNVKALCWGPWGQTKFGSGMVTGFTEAKFAEKGVKLVGAEDGRLLFKNELISKDDSRVEIICGAGPWELQESEIGRLEKSVDTPAVNTGEPLLHDTAIKSLEKGIQIFSFDLNATHAYLQEHRIDQVPVLPAAVALEIMSEAATLLWPGWMVAEVRDCRLLKGIELKEPNRKVEVIVYPPTYGASDGFEVGAAIQTAQADGRPRVHYRSVIHLKPRLTGRFEHVPKIFNDKKMSAAEAYGRMLFHGPRFQVIQKINGLSEDGSGAVVSTTRPSQWLEGVEVSRDQWIFDPGLVDAAAQMAILWCRAFRDETALPVRLGNVIRYSETLPEKLNMQFERIKTEESHMICANVYFLDDNNQVAMLIEEMECVSSAELNRVGGTAGIRPSTTASVN